MYLGCTAMLGFFYCTHLKRREKTPTVLGDFLKKYFEYFDIFKGKYFSTLPGVITGWSNFYLYCSSI